MPVMSLPTREEFLQQLTPCTVQDCAAVGEDTTCEICRLDLVDTVVGEDDEQAVFLHDKHAFGEKCAREWLADNNTCPKCRTILFRKDRIVVRYYVDMSHLDNGFHAAPSYDDTQLQQLLREIQEMSRRNHRTEASSDREVMTLYWRVWDEWHLAMADNLDGTWNIDSEASTQVAQALHDLLIVRWRWWRHSPQQLRLRFPVRYCYPAGEWTPTASELRSRVKIDFDCDLLSDFRLNYLTGKVFHDSFDAYGNCLDAAGHPVVVVLLNEINKVLQAYAGQEVRVSRLMQRLRDQIGDLDQLDRIPSVRRRFPWGYTDVIRFLIDETTKRVINRTRGSRRARRARAWPVSTAPRMSAPSHPE